jgi:hypothetical protein
MSFRTLAYALTLATFLTAPAYAQEGIPTPARKPLEGRAELNVRGGTERSILMNEFWVPLTQTDDSVLYGDIRLMGDDQENREFNAGIGYRKIVNDVPLIGDGVAGAHVWFDRRITDRGSRFNQVTAGAEWSGEIIDLKLNGYLPLNEHKTYMQANANATPGGFVGNQIVVSTAQTVQEEAMKGLDVELGFNVNGLIGDFADSTRVYAGAYHFTGDKAENVSGWRTRIASDITQDFQVGARFQKDDVRGSQGFLEATIRFPFGNKQSYREHGLYARLDESPERDIDIVSSEAVVEQGSSVPILNAVTGLPQKVLHVDNAAAVNGAGTTESPYDNLADAQAASAAYDIIYIHQGTGTTAKMNNGITLNKTGQMLIGSGTNLLFDGARFGTANGQALSSNLLIPSTAAPTITNVAGHGVTVSASDIYMAGFNVVGATGDGIYVNANNLSAQNTIIRDIRATNNGRMGVYLHGYNNGSLSAMVERTVTTGNAQHGIAVYDDTANIFDVDLGGGDKGSSGNNVLAANTFEDLAIDYDGRAITAMNNWWGYATGPDIDDPSDGIKPQIYYGAPINNGLVSHWTFDSEWMSNTIAYDRSGNNNNGTLSGGLSLANLVTGTDRQGLDFNGTTNRITVPDSNSLDIANGGSMTILSTVKTDSPAAAVNNAILTKGQYASSWNYGMVIRNGVLLFRHSNGDITGTGAAVPTGSFVDLASSITGGTDSFFVDGNFITSRADNGWSETPSAINATIGSSQHATNPPGEYFDGVIDDIRIYNRSLSPNEITELHRMNTSSSVNFSGFMTAAP